LIAEDIVDAFSSFGDLGLLVALTLIIWIDGTAFPTLPEVWLVFMYGVDPGSFAWGVTLVLVASAASLLGNFTLYYLVRKARLPSWIQKRMKQYTDFLIVKDERLLLLNRLAPMVPYTGAFIAVCGWNLRKSALFIFVSAIAKFSVIVLISWVSYDQLREDIAPTVALVSVAIVLVVSFVASVVYKRRAMPKEGQARSQ